MNAWCGSLSLCPKCTLANNRDRGRAMCCVETGVDSILTRLSCILRAALFSGSHCGEAVMHPPCSSVFWLPLWRGCHASSVQLYFLASIVARLTFILHAALFSGFHCGEADIHPPCSSIFWLPTHLSLTQSCPFPYIVHPL